MSKYFVETLNSRGNKVSARAHHNAQASLLTLAKGVTKYQTGANHKAQTETVVVTLERDMNGDLVLMLDLSGAKEPVRVETL